MHEPHPVKNLWPLEIMNTMWGSSEVCSWTLGRCLSVKFRGITMLTNVAMQIVSLFRTNVNGLGLLLERRTHSVLQPRGSLPGPFEVIRHILSVALLRYVHTRRYEEPHAPPKPLSVELQTEATKETVNSRKGTKPTAKGVRKKKKQR